jgi:hypothetical protein
MNLNKIYSIYSAVFGLLGSAFFIKGTVILSNEKIKSMAETKFGGNQELLNNFLMQKVDYAAGGVMIFIAFVLQIAPHIMRYINNKKVENFITKNHFLVFSIIFLIILLLWVFKYCGILN